MHSIRNNYAQRKYYVDQIREIDEKLAECVISDDSLYISDNVHIASNMYPVDRADIIASLDDSYSKVSPEPTVKIHRATTVNRYAVSMSKKT